MKKEYIFEQIFNIMKNSFPENEFREYEIQKDIFNESNYHYIISQKIEDSEIKYKNKDNRVNEDEEQTAKDVKGFLSFWTLEEFNFIEHIAVKRECRGQGIGTELVKDYFEMNSLKRNNLKTVLEVETPTNTTKSRRIKFYEKLGFKLNFYFYNQPSLKKGFQSVPMYIMSYPDKLDFSEFINVKEELYKNIYFI